ncbi:hypothetical protein HK098_001427 [Nowakowskiella sp. JEL0407]|nr:hypothetical protein HK098_001427 [Nowakowskiella sp. JEL0407]
MSESYVTIDVAANTQHAVISINRPPVNSMNYALWAQLSDALTYCESFLPPSKVPTMTRPKEITVNPALKITHNKESFIRGIILTSSLSKNVFTAGNDLLELYAPKSSLEQYVKFNTAQNVFLGRLLKSPLLTVAAIRGACPAGGCVLSMCCDYRIMTTGTGSDFIGLNEVALGIPVPTSWIRLMEHLIGGGNVTKLLTGGELMTSIAAKEVGLVDELVDVSGLSFKDAGEKVLGAARKYAEKILKMPDSGRLRTKSDMRVQMADNWLARVPMECIGGWELLNDPAVVKALGGVIQKLSGAKNSKL